MDGPHSHVELTDALARGRLAPAEIANITVAELDAMYELAAQCLDAGRDNEAAALLGGVVALYPFSARYWRAYGIALHRLVELEKARAAYDAALALEPDHDLTVCYRAEVWIYLGKHRRAQTDLQRLTKRGNVAADRAQQLLVQLEKLKRWRAPTPTPMDASEETTQVTPLTIGGQDLPLQPSRFANEGSLPTELNEITQTMQVFNPLPLETTASSQQTMTAVIAKQHAEPTQTAIVPDRAKGERRAPKEISSTGTAIVRRRDKSTGESQPPKPIGPETTRTAIIMRRAAVLGHEDTELIDGRDR